MSHGDEQRRRILDAGLKLWPDIAARKIGDAVGMSHTNVLYHFGNADGLRTAIAEHAVACSDARVIRYLIAEKHAAVDGVSKLERMTYMVG